MTYKPTFNTSLLGEREKDTVDFTTQLFGNVSFRMGIVLEAFDVGDSKNISKLGPEYTVMTVEQDKQNGQSTSIYKNCIAMDGFGAVADFFQFTRRKAKKPKEVKRKGSLKDEVASIVGLLCLDSHSEKAVIVGSFGNPSKGAILPKDSGHSMEGEFNGINWKIDKDGALTVLFRAATDDDGKPIDANAGGSELKFEKDGSIEINNKPTEEGKDSGTTVDYEKVRLDKTNKTIDVEARDNIAIKTDKNVNITAEESMNIKLKKDLIAMAEGKAAFTVNKTFDVEVKGAASLKVKSLMVESKSTVQMKAQSLMQLEAASSMILKAPQVLVGPSPAQPALLAFDLLVLGTGNLGGPVISNAIAGFSTSLIISS